MTTREQIIASAKECFDCYEDGRGRLEYSADEYGLERFYTIAFEAGRVAKREETNRRPLPDNTAPYIRARGDTKWPTAI